MVSSKNCYAEMIGSQGHQLFGGLICCWCSIRAMTWRKGVWAVPLKAEAFPCHLSLHPENCFDTSRFPLPHPRLISLPCQGSQSNGNGWSCTEVSEAMSFPLLKLLSWVSCHHDGRANITLEDCCLCGWRTFSVHSAVCTFRAVLCLTIIIILSYSPARAFPWLAALE